LARIMTAPGTVRNGMAASKIGVMGAGAIGCYVGGRLAASGREVVLVGRERLKTEIESHGLALTDLDGRAALIEPERIAVAVEPSSLAECGTVLVCVKSAQTAGAADELAKVLAEDTLVVSFQNGIGNADVLRARLGRRTVLAGIVGFNVISKGAGAFHQGTSGPLVIEASATERARTLGESLSASGFEVEHATNVRGQQWSKLLMNLNNAVSALSNAPTKEIILSSDYRAIVAAVIDEALHVLHQAGIQPTRMGPLPIGWFPTLLRLPTPILRVVARAQIKIDPQARSSMWEDLSRGRKTEVDYLNGEIVRLAESCGAKAPLNRRMMDLVHEAEEKKLGSPRITAADLWARLRAP
jgi:2-dehydropantoate 2-reductase